MSTATATKLSQDTLDILKNFAGINSNILVEPGNTIRTVSPVKNVLADLERGIRSGFSYSGARDLTDLYVLSKFICQTSAGLIESQTHIVNRKW